jgi:hypothetical protein
LAKAYSSSLGELAVSIILMVLQQFMVQLPIEQVQVDIEGQHAQPLCSIEICLA